MTLFLPESLWDYSGQQALSPMSLVDLTLTIYPCIAVVMHLLEAVVGKGAVVRRSTAS